jgi:hypothetical protein
MNDINCTIIVIVWSLIGLIGTIIWRKSDKTVPIILCFYGPMVFLFKKYIQKK